MCLIKLVFHKTTEAREKSQPGFSKYVPAPELHSAIACICYLVLFAKS